jgi:hypothetical protein
LTRISTLLVGLVVLGWTGSAQADLHFPKKILNLGKIKGGVPLAFVFLFEAKGTEPVEILEVRPGCGCVSPELTGKKFEPGETGKIMLKVNTLGEAAGPHRWYLYLIYRQGQTETQVPLQILADVSNEMTVQPARLSIHTSGKHTQELRLIDFRTQPLAIKEVRTTATFVQAVCGKTARDDKDNWVTRIQIKIGDDVPTGRNEVMVNIYTDDAVYRHLQVPVVVTRPPVQRFVPLPAEVKLYGTRGQPLPSRLVVIRDVKEEGVEIGAIKAGHPAIQCKWATGPGSSATLKIQIDAAKMKDDRLESEIQVEIAGVSPQTITIPVFCLLE